MDLLKKLWKIFSRTEKKRIILILILVIIGTLFEVFSITLIFPFINVVMNPNQLIENQFLNRIYIFLGVESTFKFLVTASFVLLFLFIVKNVYLYFLCYIQLKIISEQRVNFSRHLLEIYLKKPYTFHLQKNTSELIRNINIDTVNLSAGILKPLVFLISELFIVFGLIILLMIIDPLTTSAVLFILSMCMALFFIIYRRKLEKYGEEVQYSQGQMIKWASQGLGASKEIKVSRKEKFFVESYDKSSNTFAIAFRYYNTLLKVPQLLVETIIVACILFVIIIVLLQGKSVSAMIPLLTIFVVAAIRLMPALYHIGNHINSIIYSKPSMNVIYNDIIMKDEANMSLKKEQNEDTLDEFNYKKLQYSINLINISYCYPGRGKDVISNVSLSIPIGSSVAFFGPSGVGKTTLVDIILGLLKPKNGRVVADGVNIHENLSAWSKKIGYIPQFIYILDDTIRRNVAFGMKDEDIDDEKVWETLEKTQLKKFIEELPLGIDTIVGEMGMRMSGGQRQRIGIARALYYDPEILVLDEATSSIDINTEKEVLRTIEPLRGKKTVIIIAHRLSTIKNCDMIYKMKEGRLVI